MDTARLQQFAETFWEDSILPSITEYVRIPNKSPAYDPQWVEHGYMDDAVKLMEAWAREQLSAFPGATLEVLRLEGLEIIPSVLPQAPAGRGLSPVQKRRRAIGKSLALTGYVEILPTPFLPAGVFDSCRFSPFTKQRMPSACGSPTSSGVTIHGPNGACVSNDLPSTNCVVANCQSRTETSLPAQ